MNATTLYWLMVGVNSQLAFENYSNMGLSGELLNLTECVKTKRESKVN